ncbi:uncharacterized protein PV07_04615 [Cladophialophora immunda]|uniref:Transcription factor domain-containing protein n=1 Tax=Cladophialophora immunda TaxID=569365 RepID=A0A0D2DBN6_9EURO|nr:uncharacterized protein PV07_04615 [Cladophialophora immunda]KIW33124.1 hypothetical protein PV07_04615 [Cladophialophora immunda]
MALINTLHLDREPSSLDHRKMFIESDISPNNLAQTPNHHSLPEVRSFLGSFYLNSVKGMMGSRSMEVFSSTNSSYVRDCCSLLEQIPEVQNDLLLAQLVRLQLIVENIKRVFPRDRPKKDTTAPMGIILKPLELELARFKTAIPPEITLSSVLLMHFHAAEVYLYEIGILDTLDPADGLDDTQRVEVLYRCVNAGRSYFDVYHSLPISHFPYFPFNIWIQSGLVLLASTKLALFRHSAWNVVHARSALRITDIIDREIGLIEEVVGQRPHTEKQGDAKDILNGFLLRVRKLKIAFDLGVARDGDPLGHVDFAFDEQMLMTTSYQYDSADPFWDALGLLSGL